MYCADLLTLSYLMSGTTLDHFLLYCSSKEAKKKYILKVSIHHFFVFFLKITAKPEIENNKNGKD